MRLPNKEKPVPGPAVMAKLQINLREGTIDVEGDIEFVREVYGDFKDRLLSAELPAPVEDRRRRTGGATPVADAPPPEPTTNTIATMLDVSNGAELVVAAMAHLMLVRGKDSCMRREINTEMKTATDFYNENMTKSLSVALENNINAQRITRVSADTYSLTDDERTRLEALLEKNTPPSPPASDN